MTFDPLVAETSASEWERSVREAGVPVLSAAELAGYESVVVFSAHPDDETLGAGGLLAAFAALDRPVSVIVATCSEPEREAELGDALVALGVHADVTWLGLPDGGLKHHEDELEAAVEAALAGGGGGRRLVLAPWPGDRHGDHRTLGRAVARRSTERGDRVLLYPIWLWQWGSPADLPWERAIAFDAGAGERARVEAALAAFASQRHSPTNPDGVLSPELLRRAADGPGILVEPVAGRLADPISDHFERLHREADDPWGARTRWYERRKRTLLVASLPRESYGNALELGCSNGETTAALAERCDVLLGVDAAASAVALARARTAGMAGVTVERMRVPAQWPPGRFDLVVVSELAYYLARDQWAECIERIVGALAPGGEVVLCHWTGSADDFAQSGAEAHAAFAGLSGLQRRVRHAEDAFVLEVFG
ncbi:PIG-L family deacetylase [Leifsonia sp. NPDC080035]|uniref:PIG-L family deacetylase n=1 Tax=Leifsonia sp. NPDC080035 TaxID=3143936 RepID=A0AAU7G943_9MICO